MTSIPIINFPEELQNDTIVEAWNTVLFEKFSRYEDILTTGLGLHGTRLFEVHAPTPGARVLDIGCGFGDTTVTLANLVGPQGRALGVDCAPRFVEASRQRAAEANSGAEFRVADVQRDDLGSGYDAAYARFGTMFFTDPVQAFRNVRRSLVPGGRLAMSVWRKRQDNPCFYLAQRVVERFIREEDRVADDVTCGPGPFSLAGADHVTNLLLDAGFENPTLARFDAPMCIGRTLDEAVSFAADIGPAGEAIRLARAGGAARAAIDEALRAALTPYMGRNGVWAMSSTWLVSATAPRAL